MSNIKKGSKLTVSTGNGISRASSNNLGVLELSGPGLANVVSQDSTFSLASSNVPQLSIGAIDNSGIFQLGLDNQGNAILEATQNGANNNILIQQLGGYVGIGTDNPASTFHVNSTDALIIPVGTTATRPGESGQITAQNGMIRYNTTNSKFEGYGPGSAWGSLGGVIDVDGDTKIVAETSASVDNDELQFYTDGSERMIIDSSGYVGIGNSNPQTELDISGQITANTKEYTHEIEFNSNNSYDNWILFNSSYGNAGEVPVNTDWTIEYKHKIILGSEGTWSHFAVVLEEDGIDSSSFLNNTYFMYWAQLTGTNLNLRYKPADGTEVNEMIPGTGYRWSLFSDHVNVKWEFLTKNNTIRLYFNGENVYTVSNLDNPSKIFGRWGFGAWNNHTHNIINPRITYGGKTYHLTTQYSTSSTAPTLTTTTKNVELINSNNNQINIPKLHSTELYADKMFVGRNNFNDYTFNAERKIVASDGAASDYFGGSVAISGNYAIVGNKGSDNPASSGSVYIYNVQTGTQYRKLLANDPTQYKNFGTSVAISGNYAIVGAIGDSNFTGAAYIFNIETGSQTYKLTAEDAGGSDQFGISVDIDGNYAIIGSRYDDQAADPNAGAAYIFNVQTGTQHRKLMANDPSTNDEFGTSVAISGNYAIVGSLYAEDSGTNRGFAYIFNVQNGIQLHKLVSNVPNDSNYFGYSVAINGDYAIVGERDGDNNVTNAGSAHIFNVRTGERIYTLTASDGAANDFFGFSVDIDGDYAIVGARGDESAYLFDLRTGLQVKKITASDSGYKLFGESIAISGNYAIIGAQFDSDIYSNAGSAYIYGPNDPLPPLLSIDNDSGNVGIGTTEPKSLLDVNGTLQATTLTSTNLKVGRDYSFSDEKKLLGHDLGQGSEGDQFGHSVAIDGDYAAVAANYHNGIASRSGSVYVFNTYTGAEIHKLTASDEALDDQFGYSVAIDGNYLITGAPWNDPKGANSGCAYIFNIKTGEELHKIFPNDGAASDYFGWSVAISGNYAIVGAPYDHNNSYTDNGAAYIFNVHTGQELKKVVAQDQRNGLRFATTVAIDGNYAAASGWLDTTKGSNAGAVYIFNVPNGDILHKIVPDDLVANDEFGRSVAISGIYGVFSAHEGDDKGEASGVAYVYNIQNGTMLWRLTASDGAGYDRFGRAVAISGNYAVVAAWYNDDVPSDSGSAYIFDIRTGAEVKKLLSTDISGGDRFSSDVAISDNYIIVGSAFSDISGSSNSGAAYIYGPSSPYLLSIEDGVTDIPNLVTTGLTSGNFNAGRDFSFSDETKIVGHDGVASDYFGYGVAIDGDYAIVGAFNDDSGRGSAYIYNVHTGAEIHKLVASDGVGGDEFGISVAISGNYAIVGAKEDDSQKGSAYIFNVQTGTQLHKLTAGTDGATGDQFGFNVAIDGNYAIVGAWFDDDKGIDSGSAYIFNVQTGTQLHKLTAIDGAAGDRFGKTVAISGNYAIVGAYYDDSKTGAAYVFNIQTGTQLYKLTANDKADDDEFGYSVDIDGNYAIVGARFDDDSANASGSAYIFDVQTNTQLHKLVASDPEQLVYYGTSVSISGNYAIVGAEQDNQVASDAGAAYIYDVRTGAQVKKITASDGAASDIFGFSVAISGNYAIVGSYKDNSSQGAAYIYGPSSPSLLSIDNDSGNVNIVGGNVGIGTDRPGAPLEIYKKAHSDSGQRGGGLILSRYVHGVDGANNTGSPYRGACIWSEYVSTSGYGESLCIAVSGTTNPYLQNRILTITQTKLYVSSTSYSSDDRVKHNEQIITNALSTISKITPKHYFKTTEIYDASHNFVLDESGNPLDASGNYLDEGKYYIETGIIAQEIQKIPELQFAVYGKEYEEQIITSYKKDNSGNYILDESGNKIEENITRQKPNILSVDYNSIHCTHIAATKELHQLVQSQQTTIQTLQTDLSNANTIIQQQATTIQTLETQIADILTRLSNLENTGSS